MVQYYAVATVCVMVHLTGRQSKEFKTKVGVKQGGPFSPTGFNMDINLMIIITVASGLLYITRGVTSGAINYADDTTAIVDCSAKMHELIKIMEKYCKKYDIIINATKTKWMKLGDPLKELGDLKWEYERTHQETCQRTPMDR